MRHKSKMIDKLKATVHSKRILITGASSIGLAISPTSKHRSTIDSRCSLRG